MTPSTNSEDFPKISGGCLLVAFKSSTEHRRLGLYPAVGGLQMDPGLDQYAKCLPRFEG